MVQRRAARWVKQDYRLISIVSDMMNDLQWSTLYECRKHCRLLTFYKFLHQDPPDINIPKEAAVLYDVIRKWCNILSTPFVIFSPCSLFGEYGKKKGNKIKDQKISVSIHPAASGTSCLCMCSIDGILS